LLLLLQHHLRRLQSRMRRPAWYVS